MLLTDLQQKVPVNIFQKVRWWDSAMLNTNVVLIEWNRRKKSYVTIEPQNKLLISGHRNPYSWYNHGYTNFLASSLLTRHVCFLAFYSYLLLHLFACLCTLHFCLATPP